MKKLSYDIKQRKRASTLFALALTEIEAADILIQKELFRECVIHIYFASFYISQALLCQYVKARPSHPQVDSELHRIYGRKREFPKRYLKLHSLLHNLRTEINYRSAHTPEPTKMKQYLTLLSLYFKFASKHISEIDFDDILRDIVDSNKNNIGDFSIDVYCPKTYLHHVRFTAWFPPFYIGIFKCNKLANHTKRLLKKLRVKNSSNYVAGLNSKLDQYSDKHLLMLDIDSLDPAVETVLKRHGGILFKSGRGFHFLGRQVIDGRKEWAKVLRKALRNRILKSRIDKKHIEISLKRGYSTLRITTSVLKPVRPHFFKEL